jgi:integrase
MSAVGALHQFTKLVNRSETIGRQDHRRWRDACLESSDGPARPLSNLADALERTAHHRPQAAVQAQTRLGHSPAAEERRPVRDLALFDCAIDAKLRGCDLVKLKVSDVAPGGSLRERATVIQQKTGRPVPFEITETTREALAAWLTRRGPRRDDWLFPSRSRPGDHISTRQYARLVDWWVGMVGLEPRAYGTHSLRRTKVALIYKKTGNIRACQLLLGHRKLESTVRYLGIEVDDALSMSEQIDL